MLRKMKETLEMGLKEIMTPAAELLNIKIDIDFDNWLTPMEACIYIGIPVMCLTVLLVVSLISQLPRICKDPVKKKAWTTRLTNWRDQIFLGIITRGFLATYLILCV